MKKILFFLLSNSLIINFAFSQNGVSINATGNPADISAMLDVSSTTKGLLIPRVALTGTTDVTTITSGNVQSLLVFNTATVSDVTPGYYYWDAAAIKWQRFTTVAGGGSWLLTGNAGTSWNTNFLGSTDNVSLRLRTNNTERMIVDSTGNVGIGINNPMYKLDIYNNIDDAIINVTSQLHNAGIMFLTDSSNFYSIFTGPLPLNNLYFRKYSLNGSTYTNAMVIYNNANVGIGISVPTSKLSVSGGDVNILNIGSGIIMKSPNGQCWRVTIDNSGNLVRTSITCP